MISQEIDWHGEAKQNNQLTNINIIDCQLFPASNSGVEWRGFILCQVLAEITFNEPDLWLFGTGGTGGPQVEQNN